MKVSTNKLKPLWFLGILVLCGCGLEGAPAEVEIEVSYAAFSNNGCVHENHIGLPETIDRLRLQRLDGETWVGVEERDIQGNEMLFTGIPIGTQTLRFVACEGETARYLATPPPFLLEESAKRALKLHFRPIDALACIGGGPDSNTAYDRYSCLGRPRAFAAATTLADGRILVAGGAAEYDAGRLIAATQAPDWDLYDPTDLIFLPGIDRAAPLVQRTLISGRVGAKAAPYTRPGAGAGGALIIGGSQTLVLDITQPYGPFSPGMEGLSAPFVSYFDAATGQLSPVNGPDGTLTPRLFAGAAGDGKRVVIAGGVALPDEGPSPAVDVIDEGKVTSHRFGVGLYGPTVNVLDGDYALAWGASTEDCGAQPGWLIPLDGGAPTALTLGGSDPPPTCPEAGAEPAADCRAWYTTAYHSAVNLRPNAAGRPRVLVTGGLRVRAESLVSNPYFGDGCAANAFVLTIDTMGKRATVTPIDLSEPGMNEALQRDRKSVV